MCYQIQNPSSPFIKSKLQETSIW